MKKILTLVALFAGLMISANAQDKNPEMRKDKRSDRQVLTKQPDHRIRTVEESAKQATDRLDTQLKFTETQKKEVYAYQLDKAKKRKARYEEMKVEREAKREEMKAERAEFQKLLTPEQQEIYNNKLTEIKKQHMQKRSRHYKNRDMQEKRQKRSMPVEKDIKEKEVNSSNS